MNYKTIILLVLVVFLLGIACVSASEIDDTIASEDTDSIELSADNENNLQNDENNDKLTLTDNDETLSANDTEISNDNRGTYSGLREEIGSGGNVELQHDYYTYDRGGTISITIDNSVIDGKGAVIDMAGSIIRVFDVSASDVTIKNLTIKNAYYQGDGSAIYSEGSITLTNCNFIKNTADNDDAAVYLFGEATVTNCNFTDNTATEDGGAIWMNSGTVTNCNFVNNFAGSGGAIRVNGEVTVTNCNFTNNTATGSGGAINFFENGEVKNCNFAGNKANGDDARGGAVYFYTGGEVSNCNFTDNSAEYGGAIGFNNGEGTVTNCNFAGNKVTGDKGYGGAVFLRVGGTVTNCNFTNNTGTRNGGAVYFDSTGDVTNCNFADNSAGNGGAIGFNGEATVTSCNFTDNSAEYGGAVYFDKIGNVINCNFANNTATANGGAIRFYGEGTVTNCNFSGNKATGVSSYGGAIYFGDAGTVTNCNFSGNKATGVPSYGGAIYFGDAGTVTNCNFTDNYANYGGAILFDNTGTVTNCNFTNNKATGDYSYGGAVYFSSTGNVTNCNFTNNSASEGGGAIRMYSGTVSNCNFTNNSASSQGGAIRFSGTGTVSNCNFADNSANRGGAIFSQQWYTAVDTCIFKGNSGENVNIVIYPPALYVDNFTTYYGSGDKLTLNLRTNLTSSPVTNGNISISVYLKDNNSWVGNYSCLSGDGWIPDMPVGSYYAIFDTEYAEFQPINRTITIIIPPIQYYINVNSVTTNNKTVNITAKSDIPKNILWDGKLLFVLPNGANITANYGGNETWWAVYTFDDYTDYQVNATYVGLDNVTVTTGTISISKTPTEITVENATVELLVGDSVGTGASLTPADAGNLTYTSTNIAVVKVEDGKIIAVSEGNAVITVSFTGNDDYVAAENKTIGVTVKLRDASVSVDNSTLSLLIGGNFTIVPTTDPSGLDVVFVPDDSGVYSVDDNGLVTALKEGSGSVMVKVGGDGVYAENFTVVSVTVCKVPTEISILNDTLILKVNDEIVPGATLTPADAGNVTYTVGNSSVVKVENGKIIAIGEGTANITVSFAGDDKYLAAENKTIYVTVSLRDASVSVDNSTLSLLIGGNFTIVPTTDPSGLDVVFVPDDSGVYSVDDNGLVTALKEGSGSVMVKVGGDGVYAENFTVVSVTVCKVPTEISVLNDTLVLEVLDEVDSGVSLTPADAGNVTYTVSNSSVVKVENGKIIAIGDGTANITVSFAGDDKYLAAENKTISVTVKLKDASVSVNNSTLNLLIGGNFTIVPTTNPAGLAVTFIPDDSDAYIVDRDGFVTALKEGTGFIDVIVGGDGVYALNSTVVCVTVCKVPTEISVLNDTLVLKVNDEMVTGATLTPADAGNVTYTVGNSSVVKVENGKIIAIGEGTANITVSFAGDDKYLAAENKTIYVTVSLRDASVSVDNTTLSLLVGNIFQIVPTTIPAGLNVTFLSDDFDAFVVDGDGFVTALKEGTGYVDVIVGGDGVYALNSTVVSVTVRKVPTEISILNDTLVLEVNDEIASGATLTPADAGNVTYTVSNSSVVKVENGKIIAINHGTANITLSFAGDDKYAAAENKTISVTVNLKDASVSVNNSTLDLLVGDTFTIVPTTIPAGLTVRFEADGSGVCSVDENGVVTALKEGTGSVTVKVGGDDTYIENSTVVSVIVSRIPTEISILNDTLVLEALDEVATGVTLTPAEAGNVTYTVSNISVVKVENGKIIALKAGSTFITVSFAGDDKYAAAENKTISVTVNLKDASVSVNNSTLDLLVGNTFNIVPTTTPKGLTVRFEAYVSSVCSVDENGVVTALKEGTGSIFVMVGGDGIHAFNSTEVSVSVSKVPTEITVENATVELLAGNSVDAGATLTPADAGNLTFSSNNITVVKVEDGKIIALSEGSAVITVSFAGDEKYAAAENKTISVTVNPKYESKVIISPIVDVVYPNNVAITYSVENRTNVTVSIDGVSDDKIIITNDTVTVIGLNAGEYTITVINSENGTHSKSSDTQTFTVNKQATSIAATAVTATYNKNKVMTITLKDGNGKALANAKVTVVLKGTKTYTTDKNGQIKISTKGLAPKKYTAKITFNGNTNYAKSTKNVKVTVKKATPKITAKKKTFKKSKKVKKYKIKLKDNLGKAIKKAKVTIKIGKKTFKAKTNSKGKATFKIKKLTKKGKYKAKITYKGNAYYNKVTKKVKIKIK